MIKFAELPEALSVIAAKIVDQNASADGAPPQTPGEVYDASPYPLWLWRGTPFTISHLFDVSILGT